MGWSTKWEDVPVSDNAPKDLITKQGKEFTVTLPQAKAGQSVVITNNTDKPINIEPPRSEITKIPFQFKDMSKEEFLERFPNPNKEAKTLIDGLGKKLLNIVKTELYTGIDKGSPEGDVTVYSKYENGKYTVISEEEFNKEFEEISTGGHSPPVYVNEINSIKNIFGTGIITDKENLNAILTFECSLCHTEFNCNTTKFGVLCDQAAIAGWRIVWLDHGYKCYCGQCKGEIE